METALKKDIYEQLAMVWSGAASRDFTAESIVPDAMPDVAAVVDGEGVITLRGKETEAGCVTLSASVSVSVLYMPDGGGSVQSLPMTVPVELRMEAPGADTDCRTVARLRIRALDVRMVNSRKLSVRVDVDSEVRVFQRQNLSIASGLDRDDPTVHILTRTAPMTTVADVREKTFVVTDEYQLPAGCGGVERILSQRVEAVVEDVKYVSGKVVFRGRVRAGLVFDGGENGQVFAGRYETEFSQIMEVDAQGAEAVPEMTLMFTGAYFDLSERRDEDGRVSAELHLVVQTVCRQMGEVTYIADLYSNRTVLAGQSIPVDTISAAQPVSMRQTVTGSAEPMGAGGEVLTLSANVGSVTVEGETVKTSVNIRCLIRQEDGQYTAARCRLAAEFTSELPAGTELQNVTVSAADVYCALAGGSLDVRAVLQMEAMAITRTTLTCMDGMEEDPDAFAAAPATPSITLARVEAGTDMWAVARKYHSTVEAIRSANGDRESGLLLIPKGR